MLRRVHAARFAISLVLAREPIFKGIRCSRAQRVMRALARALRFCVRATFVRCSLRQQRMLNAHKDPR
jgi:hypothetical protein